MPRSVRAGVANRPLWFVLGCLGAYFQRAIPPDHGFVQSLDFRKIRMRVVAIGTLPAQPRTEATVMNAVV